jgi:hypothetical protein
MDHAERRIMRAVECPCGEHLEGQNDQTLFQEFRQHADTEHEGEYEDQQLRQIVTTTAYDAAA